MPPVNPAYAAVIAGVVMSLFLEGQDEDTFNK